MTEMTEISDTISVNPREETEPKIYFEGSTEIDFTRFIGHELTVINYFDELHKKLMQVFRDLGADTANVEHFDDITAFGFSYIVDNILIEWVFYCSIQTTRPFIIPTALYLCPEIFVKVVIGTDEYSDFELEFKCEYNNLEKLNYIEEYIETCANKIRDYVADRMIMLK